MATLYTFVPNAAEYLSASFAQLTTLNASQRRPVLAYDAGSPEYAQWTAIAPSGITTPFKVFSHGVMATATSGSLMLQFFIEAITPGDASDIGSASYWDTANSTCALGVPASAGYPFTASMQLTNTGSLVVGDYFRLRLGRNATSASDDAAGDYYNTALEFRDSQ